ncbi:MAG TPA: BTAD domain-containing putative transcriptional regulator [Candidatus Dormibacteraeota bacterium]|nr:BTAD domain-containing putative transcriptional regulator [Candidatus Dormibacteraeota bacterium]
MAAEGVRVRLLGRFEIEGVDTTALRSRKARTVLRLLALARGAPVSTGRLVDVLWSETPPSGPAEQLSVLVSRLRAPLGAGRIVRSDAGYRLDVAWSDLDAAASFLEEGERRLRAGAPAAARAAAIAALRLHRGPLLADEPEAEWAGPDRTAAERQLLRAHLLMASAALAAGDPATAATAAEAALVLEPLDEEALRALLAAHAASGRKSAALSAYERFRERLADELGVDPSPATAEAHLALLQDRAITPPGSGSAAGSPAASPVTASVAAAVLVGREPELGALDAAMEGAGRGAAQVLVVEGEAGIGKSRLVAEWSARAQARGVTVLLGRCDELGRALPLQPVLDALAAHLAGLDSDAASAVLGSEAALLADPLLSAGALAQPSAVVVPATDEAVARAVVAEAVRRVLARIAVEPTALVLEDVHLADPGTHDLLQRLRRQPPAARLLVVATRRTGEGRPLDPGPRVQLEPLDLAACASLIGEAGAAALHRRSGGNPLLLLELSRAAGPAEIPESLREAVVAQCERLGEAAPTLRAAAVLGPELDLEVLAATLCLTPITLLDHLEEGVRRRLLSERGGGFAFHHELVREALVADTGSARRALLHREAARLLAHRPRADPLMVAYHARQGGDLGLAARSLTDAARITAGRGDHAEALRLLDEAGALEDGAAVHIERARVLLLGGRAADADAEGRIALRLDGGGAALEVLAAARYHARDLTESVRLATAASAQARDGRVRAGALLLAARGHHALGDLEAAEAGFEEAAAAAEIGAAARGLWLGFLRVHQGRAAEGLRLVEAAAASPEAVINLFAPAHLNFVGGYALASLGRVEEAMRRFDDLDAACHRLGVTRFAGRADNFRGWMLRSLGDHAAADDRSLAALEAGRRIAFAEVQAQGRMDLCDGALQRADTAAAATHLTAARPFVEVEHAFRWRHLLRRRLLEARLRLLEGEAAEAAAMLEELEREAGVRGARRYVLQARLAGALARRAQGVEVDVAGLEPERAALAEAAGLDGWRLAAQVAAGLGAPAWRDTARRLCAQLAGCAGPRRAEFETYAARVMESTSIRTV